MQHNTFIKFFQGETDPVYPQLLCIGCISTLYRLGRKEIHMGDMMSNKEEGPSKALALFSCAIPCLAALSQGVLLTWLNPVLPQVKSEGENYIQL